MAKCNRCGGKLEKASPGYYQCKDCGRAVDSKHVDN